MSSTYWQTQYQSARRKVQELEAERDALAARNAELHDVAGILLCIDQCETCREEGEFNRDGVKRVINRKAPASLARRDARVKAEALDLAALQLSARHSDAIGRIRAIAAEYRQQAEGGGDE